MPFVFTLVEVSMLAGVVSLVWFTMVLGWVLLELQL